MTTRVSKEPERPDVSIVNPDGETGTDNSLAPGGTPTTEGSKPRATRWYRLVKKFERVEMDGGESERPTVSLKRGNHPEGPRGEKGTPCHDTVGGKHGGCIEARNRAHETTTVAASGTRRSADSLREPSRSVLMYEEPYARKCKYGSAGGATRG